MNTTDICVNSKCHCAYRLYVNVQFFLLLQLTGQVKRLNNLVKELRNKFRMSQSQVHGLLDERADFLAQIQDQQRDINALKQKLGHAERENADLAKCQVLVLYSLFLACLLSNTFPCLFRYSTLHVNVILHNNLRILSYSIKMVVKPRLRSLVRNIYSFVLILLQLPTYDDYI